MANEVTDHLIQWLDNDYAMYTYIRELAGSAGWVSDDYRDVKAFGEQIKTDVIGEVDPLFDHILGLVEWDEVGRHFLSE